MFLAAWQRVIDRHDVLRTGVVADGLPYPVQVVHRRAVLPVTELDPAGITAGQDPVTWLLGQCAGPMDLRRAPLMDAFVAAEPGSGRWLLGLRHHHLVQDQTTVDVILAEVRAFVEGRAGQLPVPVPYREFVGAGPARGRGGRA